MTYVISADASHLLHVQLHIDGVNETIFAHYHMIWSGEMNFWVEVLCRLIKSIFCVDRKVALHAQIKVFKDIIG